MSSRDVAAHRKFGPWRQRWSAHIAVLQGQLDRIEATGKLPNADQQLAKKAHSLLDAARDAAESWPKWSFWTLGSAKDRALASIHEVELILLQIAPADELGWRGPAVLAVGRQHLWSDDPRLRLLEDRLRDNENQLGADFRELAVSVLHAANHMEEKEIARVRNFQSALMLAFFIMSAIVLLFIYSGYQNSTALADKLCFDPPAPTVAEPGATERVCPLNTQKGGTVVPVGGDVLLVASLGAGAAALAGAAAMHKMRGSAVPYKVPMALLLLRVPVGALSALLGLVLIHGEFIPGLSALDSPAQISAWAVVFGIGQEALTRMLDKQGNILLDNVRGSTRAVDPPPAPYGGADPHVPPSGFTTPATNAP
ncbi:hypothetical protein [Streptomyces sp. C]|uniref:hypothetical protein n=1 Tax=Streptomyces sp. C TaxID=253839 RepID=UPI0001B53CF5|nr:hypothetical protein [Streptomyces sp. C]EFL17763.1 predicted protein [Streptomyces sp. C]